MHLNSEEPKLIAVPCPMLGDRGGKGPIILTVVAAEVGRTRRGGGGVLIGN